jgi:curved DNA-binding protein CbpA
VLEAFTLLGLSPTAHLADVEKAYREHALLCHPDKVAHLDAEFIELANRKFRRLQEARDLLVLIADKSPDRDAGRNGEPAR